MWIKKPMKHCICDEDHALNSCLCAFECDKYCHIGEGLKDCTCNKYFIDNLIVTCNEILDVSQTAFQFC